MTAAARKAFYEDCKDPYISVTHGMSGYFAIQLWWNPELNGFWEPYQTGIGRYRKKEHAIREARHWAKSDEIRLDPNL